MTIATRGRNEWLVPSQSKPGELYIVKQVKGQFTCDCPGNFHHGHCKHVNAVAATLPQSGPTAAQTASIFMTHRTPR